jgi:septum formation protein
LTQAGYRFIVCPSDVDEATFSSQGLSAVEYAQRLALAKARSVAPRYPEQVVLGADTIADCDGQMIGKPADAADAERITRLLFSRPHKIITGLALVRLTDAVELVAGDTTVVYPRPMTEQHIAEHIAGGTWQDRAGAYAIQETGDAFVERIEGSLTNVMGLPMELLQTLLERA